MNTKIQPFASALSNLIWLLTPLLLTFIIIGVFDQKPLALEIFLLPELGLMSIVLFVTCIQKQLYITANQTNPTLSFGMAMHMYSSLALVAAVLFCISLMSSRGYISLLHWSADLLGMLNVSVAVGACFLFSYAHVQQIKIEIK